MCFFSLHNLLYSFIMLVKTNFIKKSRISLLCDSDFLLNQKNIILTCYTISYSTLFIRVINYTVYHGIHDVIYDIIKPNDTRKITCPLNAVQLFFIDSVSISMLEWKQMSFFLALLQNNAWFIVQMLCY